MDYNFEFNITIAGRGKTANEAYLNAVTALSMDAGDEPAEYKVFNENDEECEWSDKTIILDPLYWDCECADDKPYIHHKNNGNFCPLCNSFEEDMPDSRVNEIMEKYVPELDTAVHNPPREKAE
jgi:hypothetical protein